MSGIFSNSDKDGEIEERYDTEIHKLKKEIFSKLEWSVILNDYESVGNDILSGKTIFVTKNSICTKLCNGFFDRKYGKHPKVCKEDVCYKTALLYALQLNCRVYRTLYTVLKEIRYLNPQMRPYCLCCHDKDQNYSEPLKTINEIIDGFLSLKCVCRQKNIFNKGYNESYLNFKIVNKILSTRLNKIKPHLENIVNDEIDNIVILKSLEGCIHDDIKIHQIVYCKHKTYNTYKIDEYNNLIIIFIKLINWYEENVKIITLLFNQQFYEIYRYSLTTFNDENKLIEILDNLIRIDDPYIDINYTNNFIKHNIFDLTLHQNDFPKLLEKIVLLNGKMSENSYSIALKYRRYDCANYIIKYSSQEYLSKKIDDKTAYYKILSDKDLDISKKIVLINSLLEKNIDINEECMGIKPLTQAISTENSEFLVSEIIKNGDIDKITNYDVYLAIIEDKFKILDILLQNGADVNKIDNEYHQPIFMFIKNYDKINSMNTLDVILKYGPDLDIKNKSNDTPLIFATKKNYNEIVKRLLDFGADPFITDDNMDNILTIAIKNDNLVLINMLYQIHQDEKYIVNCKNKNGENALILSLQSQKSFEILNIISQVKNLDYDEYDIDGKTAIFHLIENKIDIKIKLRIMAKILRRCNLNSINIIEKRPLIVMIIKKDELTLFEMVIDELIKRNIIEFKYENTNLKINRVREIYGLDLKKISINTVEKLNYYPIILKYIESKLNISDKIKKIEQIEVYDNTEYVDLSVGAIEILFLVIILIYLKLINSFVIIKEDFNVETEQLQKEINDMYNEFSEMETVESPTLTVTSSQKYNHKDVKKYL